MAVDDIVLGDYATAQNTTHPDKAFQHSLISPTFILYSETENIVRSGEGGEDTKFNKLAH